MNYHANSKYRNIIEDACVFLIRMTDTESLAAILIDANEEKKSGNIRNDFERFKFNSNFHTHVSKKSEQ